VKRFLLIVIGLAAIGNFLYNSTPPTGEDELIYHISLPAQWLHAGRLTFPRSNPNAFFPLNGELVTTLMLWIGGWRLAKMFVWLTGVLMALALYNFGRIHARLTVEGALWATAILYTMPCITSLNGTTSVDQLNILFEILCVDCLIDWNMIGAGVWAGLSLGTRPYSIAWVLACVPVYCYYLEELVTFLGIAALLALPYPIHNWLATGNPFYPRSFWHGASQDVYFRAQETRYALISYFNLPGWLSMGIWGFGPIPLFTAPRSFKDPVATTLWIFSGLILLLTACVPMTLCNPKYFSPMFPWLAILAAKGITCETYQPSDL